LSIDAGDAVRRGDGRPWVTREARAYEVRGSHERWRLTRCGGRHRRRWRCDEKPHNAVHRDEVASLQLVLLGLAAASDKYEHAPHDVNTVRRTGPSAHEVSGICSRSETVVPK
jgi:hypothetical protein